MVLYQFKTVRRQQEIVVYDRRNNYLCCIPYTNDKEDVLRRLHTCYEAGRLAGREEAQKEIREKLGL